MNPTGSAHIKAAMIPAQPPATAHQISEQRESLVTWLGKTVLWIPYAAADGLSRLGGSLDGADKLNKAFNAVMNLGVIAYAGTAYGETLKGILSFTKETSSTISAAAAFDRIAAVYSVEENGQLRIEKEASPVKRTSLFFLSIGKTFELLDFFNRKVTPLSSLLGERSIPVLTGLLSLPILRSLGAILGGVSLLRYKDLSMIVSATYSLIDNGGKATAAKTQQAFVYAVLGIANDLGKLTLCALPMITLAVLNTYTFHTIALTVSLIGMSKILWDSYTNPKRGVPLEPLFSPSR